MNGGIIGGLLVTSLPNTIRKSGLWTLDDVYNARNLIRATPLLLHGFDTLPSYSRGSIGLSTGVKVEGSSSLWLSKTTTTADYSEVYSTVSLDISAKTLIRLWVYIADQTAYDALTADSFFLDLGSNVTNSYRFKLQKALCTIGQWSLLTEVKASVDETVGSPPAWSNITYFRLVMRTTANAVVVASQKVFFDFCHAI